MLNHLPIQLDFEGAHNFRELGGYPLAGGRRVRGGMLFRSDRLATLSDADQDRLDALGIRTVVDLRRGEERSSAPNRIRNEAVEQIWLPVDAEGADVVNIRRELERGRMTAKQARNLLVEANRQFTGIFAPVFSDFLHLLLEKERYPIVFHCSAGKDRAGFAAAMTLYALGAEDETVMHDYMATNHCTAGYLDGMIEGILDNWGIKVDIDAVRMLMSASEEFLGAALEKIKGERGGMDAFVERDLDFDRSKREQLLSLLAEPDSE